LLAAWKKPTPPVKSGSSSKIEMNMFKAFLNIVFNITHPILGCQLKK